jgi:hypothetical protein
MNLSEQMARLEWERDALQARINAGVRMHRSDRYGWGSMKSPDSTHTGLLIDREPIAQADDRRTWTRADGSTNPRVGERRKASDGASWRINQTAETVGKIRWGTSKDRRKA